MYCDNHLEYKKGSLMVKKTETAVDTEEDGKMIQKQRRLTKFNFSGTNYEVQTMGYLAGIEDEHNLDPDLFTKICNKARQASGAQKPASEVVEDKFASMRLEPAFLARASLHAKISGRAIRKPETPSNFEVINETCQTGETENGENGKVYKMNDDADEANGGENEPEEVMDGKNAGCEASANKDNDASREDQDESGEEQLVDDGYVGYGGMDFEGDLSQLTALDSGDEEELEYALTEDSSQA